MTNYFFSIQFQKIIKMKKRFICLLAIAAIVKHVSAQDEFDALRYSFTPYQGTARGMGIGGAVGSIGADFSCLSVNPAGIGIYKSSELLFSPSFTVSKNNSTYLGTSSSANASKFNLSNFGIVITNNRKSPNSRKNGWKSINFGFGMNRLATYKNEFIYSGKNTKSSLIESFADDFNSLGGINSNSLNNVNYSAYAAYQTYLIDRGMGADSNKAMSYVPFDAGINQTKRVIETGGMSEYAISIGGNYMDKLMIGATLGISSLKYNRTLRFDEVDASNDLNNDFKYMRYTEQLATTGNGINLKLGAIFKPNSKFRVGIALHTPTHIELNDASSISMESHTDSLLLSNNPTANPVTKFVQDSMLVFNYSMTTPYKAILSGTVLFGKLGFLTADIEYVDYSFMKYNYGAGYENESDAMNRVIQNTYQGAVNLRVGAEAKLNNFNARTGIAYYGSPYADLKIGGARTNISGGIGYRERYWFLDATYIHSIQKTNEVPYILARNNADVQAASINNNRGNVVISFGVKF